MSLWEYKVITSGKGGFAAPAMLEKFLNDLGRDEWEIIEYHSLPENMLAFTGLARRTTQRDWTLQDAATAAAKAEADKLRAEFEAKFKAATSSGPTAGVAPEERAPSFLEEKAGPDDGFRKPVDTSRDDEPEAEDESKNDWDKLTAAEEDELPTFFDAIKPHMRRNQRGAGMSVGADYLAKKWDQSEDDVKGALVECGFVVPADEDARPEYLEYDGDLYWLNINRRGELWINTKEKPRPVFRAVKAQRVAVEEEPKAEAGGERPEARGQRPERETWQPGGDKPAAAAVGAAGVENSSAGATTPTTATATEAAGGRAPQTGGGAAGAPKTAGSAFPQGIALLDKIRPHMRRNRRGPGGSGSTTFLARPLRCTEADLVAAFATLGLVLPATPAEKPVFVEFGAELWWLNQDSRGGLWINGREKKSGETAATATGESESSAAGGQENAPAAPAPAPEPLPPGTIAVSVVTEPVVAPPSMLALEPTPAAANTAPGNVLAAVRLLLKETRTGGFAGKLDRVADELGKSPGELTAALVGAGLAVPEKAKQKPVFVEHAGEIFWFNKNAKDELWLNAKASKFSDTAEGGADGEGGDKKPARRGGGAARPRKKSE